MFTLEKQSRVSFGLFQANLETGELWRAGRKVRLQTQPFKVLEILIKRSGEVVSREDLQREVWDPGTNVDFDRALAGAINKIRDALGDSAENPRFIETLAKRGYRFIAPVQRVNIAPEPEAPGARIAVLPEAPVASPTLEPTLPLRPPLLTSDGLSQIKRRNWGMRTMLPGGVAAAFLLGWLASSVRNTGQTSPVRLDQITFDSPVSPGPPNAENLPSLIAVNNQVITSVLVNGKPRLAGISSTTGEVHPIALPQELGSTAPVDVSRDGTKLLVLSRLSSSSEQPLWLVPTDGGSARRVGGTLAHDAAWMPDGAGILYASGNNLSVISSENGGTKLLATLPGRAFWLRWSPDGTLLRFTLMDSLRHTTALWEMASDKQFPHPVAALGADHSYACCGTWTADGSAYVFQEARPYTTDLWELKRGYFGPTLLQLTNGPLRYFSPVAARTGHRVYLLGSEPHLRLQQFDPQRREFIPGPEFLKSATRVSFSRNGIWAAWVDVDGRLWRARAADGSEELQLTSPEVQVFSAAWSPDGSQLALMARTPDQPWQVSLIGAGGGELKQISHEKHNAADPTWSADGQLLAFGGEPDLMGTESGAHSIGFLELSTGKTTALPGSEGLFSPRWSPDGRWIAALSLDQKQIRLFDTQKQQWHNLAATSAADPVWSHDSKSLFVHSFMADQQPIFRIDVPSGAIHQVATLDQLRSRDADYFFSGLNQADQPLVLPRVGTSNLYSLDFPN